MKKGDPKEKKEQEWNDEIPDEENDENDEAYEKTYRDGSVQHECWDPDAYTGR